MNSKQEKLAAARKKLKEFQGKQKDIENIKQNYDESILKAKYISNSLSGTDCLPLQCTENINNTKNIDSGQKHSNNSGAFYENDLKANFQENKKNRIKDPEVHSENENLPTIILENLNPNKSIPTEKFNTKILDNTLKDNKNECHVVQNNNLNEKVCITSPSQIVLPKIPFYGDSISQLNEMISVTTNELPELSKKELTTNFTEKDASNSIQLELQNHIQTINILIQQRNEAQNALLQSQSLLNEKSGEVDQQKQSIINLTHEMNELHKNLCDVNMECKSLKLENETNLENYKKAESNFALLQSQIDAKNEEFLELKKKYEEKKKECENLKNVLSESQSQLSLCLIQLQELSNKGNSELTLKVSDLQNENLSLKEQFENLKKQLEIIYAEKDQSEQKFHIYAQQCNSQLSTLNSQIKSLTIENEKVKQDNNSLLHKLSDVENEKKGKLCTEDRETELAELQSKINNLLESNKKYQSDCQKKAEDIKVFYEKIQEKENTIKNLTNLLNEAEVEKQNLIVELETPKANKQLLAAMESDKIAAAKAVSQNQKLKIQVIELEKAFVKLSEEKLKLTDQLSYEKHVNKELQDKIATLNSHPPYQSNYDNPNISENHCNDECGDTCEALVNDSDEIEELRNIIRELQNDKIELKARLNSFTSSLKKSNHLENSSEKFINDVEKNELESQNLKFILQQMEEKVRKTMNEVAVLDEEKEKLEHLVMQLQGETETIGEYITLYQRQRMLLRQRAQEKDNQLIQLSKDKEELRSKLVTLDVLVQLLIKERNNYKKHSDLMYSSSKLTEEDSDDTAGKIRALISEIGSTNLINNQTVGIEHCSCCSGRLITI